MHSIRTNASNQIRYKFAMNSESDFDFHYSDQNSNILENSNLWIIRI